MTSSSFETRSHGKWILAGEHAVIRGHKALVFPIKSKSLTLSFKKRGDKLSANFSGDYGDDMHLLFFSVLEHGMSLIGKPINAICGEFNLSNDIPIGTGLGASAALCAAMAKWFINEGTVDRNQDLDFAKSLEDLFHGKSSGLDIAGSLGESGVAYQQGRALAFTPCWQPQWYLSFTGQIAATSHCVKKVQDLWDAKPEQAHAIDEQMSESVKLAQKALMINDGNRNAKLAHAIHLASLCFKAWGLAEGSVSKHLPQLKEYGALAAKPTGSGNGGYVLSLWDTEPPKSIRNELIAV